jgi:hypothetical protein
MTSFPAQHAQIVNADNGSISLSFELSDLERREVVKENETYDVIGLPDEGMIYAYGEPLLPSMSRFVVVPPDVGIELIVRTSEPRRTQGKNSPAVCDDEGLNQTMFREFTPNRNSRFPAEVAEMADPYVIRGVRVVKITTYPIQYEYETNSYIEYDRIDTELRFTDDPPVNPARVPIRRNRSKNFLNFIDGMTMNGADVGRDDPDTEPEYIGHYCIAVMSQVQRYAAPFIEWRRKSGYKVDVIRATSGDYSSVKQSIQRLYDGYLDDGIDPFEHLLVIGDRPSYGHGPAPGAVMTAYSNSGDYWFGCLEGNDEVPDVGIARWPSGTEGTCRLAVGRTLAYEATPYMEDTSWFTKGACYSQHWGNSAYYAFHITQSNVVRWGVEVLESLGFDDVWYYEDLEFDQFAARLGPEITDIFNEGRNVMLGRAELYWYTGRPGNRSWEDFYRDVDDNVIFPVEINTCGHGEWSRENIFRAHNNNLNELRGPVTTTFTWSGPVTMPNNAIWLEMVNGLLLRDLPFGWAYSYGISVYEQYIPNQNYAWFRTNVNDFGDPGLQVWKGVPTVVEAEFPGTITSNTRMIEVHVTDTQSNENLPGAQVTLYSPMNMPDYNSADYATYDDMIMLTKKTDSEGMARFNFEEEVFDYRYELFMTITGRSICPYFGEIDVERNETTIDIASYVFLDSDNEVTEEINPGDELHIALTAVNLSSDQLNNVTAVVSSASPWVTIPENQISFGNIASDESEDGDDVVEFIVSPTCPDGETRPLTKPQLLVDFQFDNGNSHTGILLNPSAPNFEVQSIVGGSIISTDRDDLNIELSNIGKIGARDVHGRLSSLGLGVSITQSQARWADLDSEGGTGRITGNQFEVSGNSIVPPGFRNPMMLIINANDGFIDTVYFELQIDEPRENAPSPPDPFGYMCFDDTDEGWEITPTYEWIEISTEERERDFDGTMIEYTGESPHDRGENAVIDLGFTSRLYGRDFDQITVSTNGYIGIGDQEGAINHQNWPMDRAIGGAVGMLAPLWDDLRISDGGIYYYYDEGDSKMIIEWYKMEHASGQGGEMTFQVIIYDAAVWIVEETGNPFVLFQYKEVANVNAIRPGGQPANVVWTNSIPYASIGISSPDGYGINYTFNNRYPVWAAEIENRRAILFTTTPRFKSGCLEGWVLDYADDTPIAGAVVYTKHGCTGVTDENGYYFIQDALAEVLFDITASKFGYNDSVYVDTLLVEADTMEVNFKLLHPEFTPSTLGLSKFLDPELTSILPFSIENTGNGPLDWTLARRLPGNADVDPWEFRLSFAVSDSVSDTRVEGVVFINNQFYVSGANVFDGDSENMIYVLDRDGHEVNRFPQFGEARFGMKDLAWDGELIWGCSENMVFGFTTAGDSITAFEVPERSINAIAWDPDREVLWVAAKTGDGIFAMKTDGSEVDSLRLPRYNLKIYGLAYWPDAPDDSKLYIFHNPDNISEIVYKIDPDTQDTTFVRTLTYENGGNARGAFCTNQYDVYSWVFMCISDNAAADRIDIWQLDARRDWFRVFTDIDGQRTEVDDGRIDATIEQDFELQLSSVDLPDTTFIGMLEFSHNAEDAETVIDVMLDVIGPIPPTAFSLIRPANSDTVDANPSYDTTSVVFGWQPSIEYNYDDTLTYVIWLRSGADTVSIDCADDTLMVEMNYLINELGLPIETEFQLEWWVEAYSGEDIVPSDEHFTLRFSPHGVNWDDMLPIEFGLHSIYPSPFNSMTTIKYGIEVPERIRIRIFDLQGRTVATLVDGVIKRGNHNLVWDASKLSSGLYIVRLEAPGRSQIMKAALVR